MDKVIKLIVLLLLFAACKKESINDKSDKFKNTVFKGDGVEYRVDFPDTIYKGKEYNGKIIYKNWLDTITTSLDNDYNNKKNRYIIYSLTTTKNIDYEEKHLWKIAKDTFGAIDCNTIPFYNVKFNEVGVFYIDGVINDQGYITSDKKNKNGDYDTRIITNEFRATHKVVVIDEK